MRLSETKGIVYVLKPADYGAAGTGESINTEGFGHITYLIQCATFTDNSSSGADLTVKSGIADGTQTTAETFNYRIASGEQAAASADVFGSETAATTFEMTNALVDSKMVILEMDVSTLTAGANWLTLALNSDGTAANCSCVAILSDMRYVSETPPTALA